MSTTLITTILNGEKTIAKFLDSLKNQTKFPDEVIIVDGGSTDKTINEVLSFQKKSKIKIKFFEKKGNISVGRNFAIKNSSNEIILCTDADCMLDKNWAENISKPFADKDIDVVSGFYKPITKNIFEKSLSTYTCVYPDKVNPDNFLPSSRSIAFRKNAWKKAGGYPQWLDRGEDLFFARKIRDKGLKFIFVKNAIVYWPQRESFKDSFRQFFGYALGDGRTRYIRINTKFLFARYIAGIAILIAAYKFNDNLYALLILLILGYIFWSIHKNYKYVKDKKAFIYLPLLQFVSDLAVILGMSWGFLQSFAINKKRI